MVTLDPILVIERGTTTACHTRYAMADLRSADTKTTTQLDEVANSNVIYIKNYRASQAEYNPPMPKIGSIGKPPRNKRKAKLQRKARKR